jgi:hypothetical protein
MRGAILPLTQYAFPAWYSVKKKHRDNFTFTILILSSHLHLRLPSGWSFQQKYWMKCVVQFRATHEARLTNELRVAESFRECEEINV